MNPEMGNQGEGDQFCKFERVDYVSGLWESHVFGVPPNTVLPAVMLRLPRSSHFHCRTVLRALRRNARPNLPRRADDIGSLIPLDVGSKVCALM